MYNKPYKAEQIMSNIKGDICFDQIDTLTNVSCANSPSDPVCTYGINDRRYHNQWTKVEDMERHYGDIAAVTLVQIKNFIGRISYNPEEADKIGVVCSSYRVIALFEQRPLPIILSIYGYSLTLW